MTYPNPGSPFEGFVDALTAVAESIPVGTTVTITITNDHPPAPVPAAQVTNIYRGRRGPWVAFNRILHRHVTERVYPLRMVTNNHHYVVNPETTERYHPFAGLFAFIGAVIGALISVWSVLALQVGDVNIFTNGMSTVVTSLHNNPGLLTLAIIGGAAIIGGIGYWIGLVPALERVRQTTPRYVDANSAEAEDLHQNSTEV